MLKIFIAKTAEQIDDVLKLRHQVTAKIQNPSVTPSPLRLMDRFDTFPTTTHLVASKNNDIIGSLRLTLDSPAGTPVDSAYDFRSAIAPSCQDQSFRDDPNVPIKILSCDQHYVYPSLSSPQISLGLLLVASYLAISKGGSHLISPVGPEIFSPLESIGFKAIAYEQYDQTTHVKFLPMVLDIQRDLKDSFLRFSQKHELQGLMHSYGCALYEPGESILRAGTAGDCAFVIGEGEVVVKHPGKEEVIDTMGAGEVFGELALLTDQVRSVDIIAKTEVRTMILEKATFVDHLMAEPELALKLLQSMGHRMRHLIDYCTVLES